MLGAATLSMAGTDAALRLTLASGLVLMSGAYFVIAAAARLGSVTDFISKPVLRGFALGLAVVIILKQCASILGVRASHNDLVRLLLDLFGQFSQWNWTGVATGLAALVMLYALGRIRYLPAGLIVIAGGIAAKYFLDLPRFGVAVVGPIQLQLHTPRLPELSRADWLRLGELGFALVMVLYSESYGSIRSFAIKHGDAVAPNRDLLALGAANTASGLFLGMPIGAGYSGTSANEAAGACSQLSGGIAAVVMLCVVLTLLPAIALTPEPVLAAIVIHAVSHALNPRVFRPYFVWHRDRLVAIGSVVFVLWLGVLDGLLAAIAISLTMLLRRLSGSTIAVLGRLGEGHDFVNVALHPDARQIAGLLILRPDEPLFFANADRILAQARLKILAAGAAVNPVVVSLEESFDLDSSSLESLQEFFDWCAAKGKRLVLARLKEPVQELLGTAISPGPAAPVLTGLSVDDAVALAVQTAG